MGKWVGQVPGPRLPKVTGRRSRGEAGLQGGGEKQEGPGGRWGVLPEGREGQCQARSRGTHGQSSWGAKARR